LQATEEMNKSEQDVQTVTSAYDDFNSGNPQAVLDRLSDDCKWTEPGGGNSAQGTFTGPGEVGGKVFSLIPEYFDEFKVNVDDANEEDGKIVVKYTFTGKAKSGAELNTKGTHTWTVDDGKITSFDNDIKDADNWAEAWG
jgi:ketosteroid isomerase-like protein